MIKELSVRPKAQNNNSKILMSVFFALAAVSLVISMLIDLYRGVVGMVAVAFLVSAILVYTKYVSISFSYDVMIDADGEPLFLVRQFVGKREVTLCRVSLADIETINRESAAERKAHITERGVQRYVYSPTLSPAVSYRLTVANRYERSEIILEGSEEFMNLLLEYSKEARASRVIEDEE